MTTTIQYGHWGITVSTRVHKDDYAPIYIKEFGYPVGTRGPIDDWRTEFLAIQYCRSIGGEVKGPFFYREDANERRVSA